MMIRIKRQNKALEARVLLPASKSISNRLLILQFHYGGGLQIDNLSRADDTVLMDSLLEVVRQYQGNGSQGILHLDVHNAGTVFRFLTALLAIKRGHFLLTGHDRLKERPIGPLVEALRSMGAEIEYIEKVGFAPILIKGHHLEGGTIRIDGSLSSQFLSAMLLIAPMLENGLVIEPVYPLVSLPYIKMTVRLLEDLGIRITFQKNRIEIMHQENLKGRVKVEPDWSAASSWYCMLALAEKGWVRFPGLIRSGYQGDEIIADIFDPLGTETVEDDEGIIIKSKDRIKGTGSIDFSDNPDLAMPVIMAFAITGEPCKFSGLERLRLKESDRLAVMERELQKIGISLIQSSPNRWETIGSFVRPGDVFVQDEDDHRIAMTFASLAMKDCSIFIEDPQVVNKSYPGFWKDLESAGFEIHDSC